jgi:hypothetical protein
MSDEKRWIVRYGLCTYAADERAEFVVGEQKHAHRFTDKQTARDARATFNDSARAKVYRLVRRVPS